MRGSYQTDELSDSAEFISGDYEEFNDPDTSANVIGSNAELGGVSTNVKTYDDHTDSDVINLTGMSESPMVATDDDPAGILNPAGSGGAGQQVAALVADPDAANDISDLVRSSNAAGQVVGQAVLAPRPAPAAPVLVQTSQRGLSLHANLILFFILGATLGVIALSLVEG